MPDPDRLLEIFRQLGDGERKSLLDMAEFLLARNGFGGSDAAAAPAEPQPIPRPDRETVIGAMRRLSSTYPMIDRATVLHQTSALMAEHMLSGRDAVEVIDELEALFNRAYEKLGRG